MGLRYFLYYKLIVAAYCLEIFLFLQPFACYIKLFIFCCLLNLVRREHALSYYSYLLISVLVDPSKAFTIVTY